jgi:glutamate formiminotransferase
LFDGSFEEDAKNGRAIITYYDDDKKIVQAGFNQNKLDG